tara:strand:+ start:2875 stop:4506 length:1632 start_codon:yes stop_codon:yes gene_type:complete
MARFIFVTGGVVSSLGKGLASASLASLLQHHGYKVRIRKLDPYLNVDPGTMSPYQHGEVYVTDDGAETDLDLGHYERFTGVVSKQSDNITSGKVYQKIISKERKGEYLGATVQVIPHVTNEIKEFIGNDIHDEDFVICEIGGTIGDIESLPFIEAIRQFNNDNGRENSMFVHVTLVPFIASSGELKTKPTQHSVKELRSLGIQPDILLCRADRQIPADERKKIGLFCNVKHDCVIQAINANTIYEVPINFKNEEFDKRVLEYFNLEISKEIDLKMWSQVSKHILKPDGEVTVGIVGKYTGLADAYKSLNEALSHGGIFNNVKVNLKWIESEELDKSNIAQKLSCCNGILVPGGFGERGSEGKIMAINYARINNVPYFGICFGMQLAVIEMARNILNIQDANSSEFGNCQNSIVGLMTEWTTSDNKIEKRELNGDLGGTMRLGAYKAKIKKDSKVYKIYENDEISERHRHRYEVNNNYEKDLNEKGVIFSGYSPDGLLPEIVEISSHPWFIGVQFHPELKSKPFDPHPLFKSFISAAKDQSRLV